MILQEMELFFGHTDARNHGRTDGTTDGWTDKRDSRNSYLDVSKKGDFHLQHYSIEIENQKEPLYIEKYLGYIEIEKDHYECWNKILIILENQAFKL